MGTMTCNAGCTLKRFHEGPCNAPGYEFGFAGAASRMFANMFESFKPEVAVKSVRSGLHIDLMRPDAAEIRIDDIAYALARKGRFDDHTVRRYTVAEHCLLGRLLVAQPYKLAFLLHDATEAYLGDVCGPLKLTRGMVEYRALEARWATAIARRFGLDVSAGCLASVERADKEMLLTEQRDLMGRMPLSTDRYKPLPFAILQAEPSADALTAEFLRVFYKLVAATPGAKA